MAAYVTPVHVGKT